MMEHFSRWETLGEANISIVDPPHALHCPWHWMSAADCRRPGTIDTRVLVMISSKLVIYSLTVLHREDSCTTELRRQSDKHLLISEEFDSQMLNSKCPALPVVHPQAKSVGLNTVHILLRVYACSWCEQKLQTVSGGGWLFQDKLVWIVEYTWEGIRDTWLETTQWRKKQTKRLFLRGAAVCSRGGLLMHMYPIMHKLICTFRQISRWVQKDQMLQHTH